MTFKSGKTIAIIMAMLLYAAAACGSPGKIAILPFTVFSPAAAEVLQRDIAGNLATELDRTGYATILPDAAVQAALMGKKVNEKTALRAGELLGADLVIFGSITRLGERVSADLLTVTMATGAVTYGIFGQTEGATGEHLRALAVQLTREILTRHFQDKKILRVEIKGNNRIESSVIMNTLTGAEGTFFSRKALAEDIKSIYRIGYFQDVRAEVEETPSGIVLTFTVQEMPLVSEVDITGNDEVKKDDLKGLISVEPHRILNLNKLKADTENIKAFYRNKGYLEASVEYLLDEQEHKVKVTFEIKENEQFSIKTITFEGNKAYTEKELKGMMETSEWRIWSFITESGVLNEDKLNQDVSKLAAFYLNNGYINAQVGDPVVTHDEKWIYITIAVSEGKQFKIGRVEITGDTLAVSREELMDKLTIRQKDYFDREAIMKDIDYLTEACNNEGFAYANIIPQTVPREKEQEVDVTYLIQKGDLVYINRISITGNSSTRDKVIRRELDVTEGDLYNRGNIKSSYAGLNRLRYFSEINFNTEKGPKEDLMDININVKEQPTGMFSIGAGYSAEDSFILMGKVTQQNLFGRGQTLTLNAYLGAKKTNYEISFIEPWLFDIPLWSKLDLWSMKHEYDSYDLDSKGSNVTLGYPLFEKVVGYVGYRLAFDDVANVTSNAATYIKEQEGETTSSGVTVTLTRDTTDDIIFPSKGSKNSVSVEHTGTVFGGDVSYTKYQGTSSWFFPLPLDLVIAGRGRIGYVHGNDGKEVPIYERFYLGGINSLRGLRNIGPIDPDTGDVIGGETMLNFNAELIIPIIKDAGLKGVLFFDTGNAWESGYHPDDMRKTAGAGIRWYSPMGPLRLEYGYVLDRKIDEPESRWEFTIGMFM
ncbi:MAG: outer membrane protein assembly factor BamA [Deltaproteobacteria bacterium]|nr:outer membrane protein assembly factor BamA [Deltaproteobacteria bacterium]